MASVHPDSVDAAVAAAAGVFIVVGRGDSFVRGRDSGASPRAISEHLRRSNNTKGNQTSSNPTPCERDRERERQRDREREGESGTDTQEERDRARERAAVEETEREGMGVWPLLALCCFDLSPRLSPSPWRMIGSLP